MRLLAIDPGKDKCGIAILDDIKVLEKKVIPPRELYSTLNHILKQYQVEKIILGDRTFSSQTKQELEVQTRGIWSGEIVLVDEHFSTQQARSRYWQENPPKGLKRLIPLSMQTPPEPYDHYVALILAERYLSQLED